MVFAMDDEEVQNEPEDNTDEAEVPETREPASVQTEAKFNDNIYIETGKRLEYLDKGPVEAYVARGNGKATRNLFALLCEDHLTPRSLMSAKYSSIINPGMAKLVASGALYWPPEGRERYAFIYENTLGQSIMPHDLSGGLSWKPDYVIEAVIRPMVNALMDLRDKSIIHGDIRPSNMFDGGVKNTERVLLGECLSTSASFTQPVLYESIERAMADPLGRGEGFFSDDLYSFGVSLAVILRTHNPLEGKSDAEILDYKMEHGSFPSLIGQDRFTGNILDLLRGLLQDDPAQRWNLKEVEEWMGGERLSPKAGQKKLKANRPIPFNGRKYTRPEFLAYALKENPSEAVQLVDNGEMDKWLKRAIDNDNLKDRVDKSILIAQGEGRGSGFPDVLATRLGIALYPDAPLRYKEISSFPDGLGKSFTEAYIQKKNIQEYQELFEHYFVGQWVDMYPHSHLDIGVTISQADNCRNFLRQNTIGFGIERCLYFMNPESKCLSEKVKDYFVRTPEDMMRALEGISTASDRPASLFDRHIIAFLSVKDRKNIDPYFMDLKADEPYRKVLGELKTLATIQKRSRMEKFPGIANWLAVNLEPLYLRFHDRDLREKVKARVEKLKKTGDLVKIATEFDSQKRYEGDQGGFLRAQKMFFDLEKEARNLNIKLTQGDNFGQATGQQAGAVVSGVVAAFVIVASAFLALVKGGSLF